MAKLNKAIGKMPCLCCGESITVKQSETGTLALSCPDCDLSAYARSGTDAHRRVMARIKLRTPEDAPAPAPKPAPKPAPAPAPKPAPKPAPAPAPKPAPAPVMQSLPVTAKHTLFG